MHKATNAKKRVPGRPDNKPGVNQARAYHNRWTTSMDTRIFIPHGKRIFVKLSNGLKATGRLVINGSKMEEPSANTKSPNGKPVP